MRYSAQIKPISFLKAHAAEILRDLAARASLVIGSGVGRPVVGGGGGAGGGVAIATAGGAESSVA